MSSHAHPPHAVGRGPLLAAGSMVIFSLLVVAIVRLTGVGMPSTAEAPAVAVREFRFEDRVDGSIDVLDGRSGHTVASIAPGSNGFLRGTMRGMARERKRQGFGPEQPFRMVGHADGHLTLEDPATGRRIDLGSFGPTNAAVFGRLMVSPSGGTSPLVIGSTS